jgi:HK97 family phage prohead protease
MRYAASPFDIKALDDTGQIEGLLAGFGDVDQGGDRLMKGCFAKSLAARSTPLPMLFVHDLTRPIGAWKQWEERRDGLFVRGSLTLAAQAAQEAYALAKEGAVTGLSIGFQPTRESTDQRTGVRTITEAKLYEGSLVPIPMHDRARIAAVKAIAGPGDIAELLQQSGGMSRERAKIAAQGAWKALIQPKQDDAVVAELAALVRESTARLGKGVR